MTSFVEKLDKESLDYFSAVCKKPFSEQAVAFLNAYWPEVHQEAEFIFTVAWEMMKYADMTAKGVHAHWKNDFPMSQPEMMTAIKRKQELREKVDVNFDGRVSFLEYLLHQYRAVANPADFCKRSMTAGDEHPEIVKARMALEEVNKRIRAYEAEKARLTEESQQPGVKGLRAKNLLAQLDSSPLAEELNKALITAEAAVRIATRKFGGQKGAGAGATGEAGAPLTDGAIWWMNRDLQDKQSKYGKKK